MFGNNNNNNGAGSPRGSPGLQNFSSLGFGNNASSAPSSPATGGGSFAMPRNESGRPTASSGFSFGGPPSASSSFSSSPSTTTTTTTSERMSGQASPKMLVVSQKNLQIKAEAAVTNILVNRWGPHMLQLFMKEFNSMPDQVKLLNDSQQLEQMMRSWIPGNNIFKKNFKPIIPDIIHPFETYF